MSKKLSFWFVVALVIGSQIGSGILVLPSTLAPYGYLAIYGWILAALGASSIAYIFAQLSCWLPKTGGPHTFINAAFGKKPAFFVGWTYWLVSWVSTIVVIKTGVVYLVAVFGNHGPIVNLAIELMMLFFVILVNIRGLKTTGIVEISLSILKLSPLIIIPIIGLWFFDSKNFYQSEAVLQQGMITNLGKILLLAMWGFIGVEAGTTPAGSVNNPSKTIPRATIVGTLCVAIVYILNNTVILGAVPGAELIQSGAPYASVMQIISGDGWSTGISLIAFLICLSTTNSWTLASSQVALGLSESNLIPKFFAKKNKAGSPYISVLASCLCIIPGLLLTMSNSLSKQIEGIINLSVVAFVFVYLICIVAFFKIAFQQKKKLGFFAVLFGCIAFLTCTFIILDSSSIQAFLFTAMFVVSGVPVYLWMKKSKQ